MSAGGAPLGHPLFSGHRAVPRGPGAPIAAQDAPLNFGTRAEAVSWAWVASRDSWCPGVVLLWGRIALTCAPGTLVSLHRGA